MQINLFEAHNKPGILESGKALVSNPNSGLGKVDNEPDNTSLAQMYENAYLNVPLIGSSVDVLTDQTVQEFFFEGPNQKAITKFADKQNLWLFFHRTCKMMLIFGNAYVEVVKEGEEIEKLKILDSKNMVVVRENTGKVIGYVQDNGTTSLVWGTDGNPNSKSLVVGAVDDIVHFKYNLLGSDKYGTSLIHRNLPSTNQKLDMEQYMSTVVERYIAPIIHAKVGTDENPATATDITSVESALEDIRRDTEYVTSHLVDMEVLGFKGKTLDFIPLFDHVDKQIITGMMVTGVLLGRGKGVDGAVAEVQLRGLGRTVKSIQRTLKTEFEDEIIVGQGLGDPEDKLIWGSVEEREKTVDIDLIMNLSKAGLITKQKANDLLPPKFNEKLPEDLPLDEEGNEKVQLNPNDPTMTTKGTGSAGRMKKQAVRVPMDDKNGVKKNQPKVKKEGVPK